MIEKILKLSYNLQGKKRFYLITNLILILMVFSISGLVYISGGTTSFVHLMYIPIVLSVFIFNIKIGIIYAMIAGLLLGPYMPLSVKEGIQQETISWVFRIIVFVFIAIYTGGLFKYIKAIHNLEIKKFYYDIITGFPNANKFKEDVTKLINEKKFKYISFVIFEFKNKEMINQYVNYEIGHKTYNSLLKSAHDFFETYPIYSVDTKMFVLVLPGSRHTEALARTEEFFKKIKKPVYIDGLPVSIVLKAGIVNYPKHSTGTDDIVLKLGQSLSQALISQKNIIVYDQVLQSNRTKYYYTLVSLYHSLQNDLFTLHYQPKIHLATNKLIGVEALLRFQDDNLQDMSVQRLITIAEEVGFINEITKWVIRKVLTQIQLWKEDGIEINVSINLSPQDFNQSICDYALNSLESQGIEPSRLEFELTERTIIEDEVTVLQELTRLKEKGIKLSLDDYGTGHNSLNYLVKSAFCFDYIKIDKAFINDITKKKNKLLIGGIIETAHVRGLKVIAEGVESQDQLEALKEINCDYGQGYLFGRPMPPEELVQLLVTSQVFNAEESAS